MQFNEFSIDQFGMFQNFPLSGLAPGLTVIYGGNGTGKTTLVHFLRGVLFGYHADSVSEGFRDVHNHGYLDIESTDRRFRLRRRARTSGVGGLNDDLEVVDRGTDARLSSVSNRLPDWVSEDVYREIFSVGHQEADRFDLLTRLCLSGPLGGSDIEAEIRRAEIALDQAVRERTGDATAIGLVRQIEQLAARRRALQDELAAMRTVSPSVPARIAELEGELAALRQELLSLANQIAELQAEIARLEARRRELLQRNLLALDRDRIQAELVQIDKRMETWSAVQATIEHQGLSTSTITGSKPHTHESLRSVRALISRLEHRLNDLEHQGAASGSGGLPVATLQNHLRDEIFALCDYAAKHEAAVVAHEQGLEAMFASRALQSIASLQDVIRGRRDCLRDELQRADNILAAKHFSSATADCSLEAHRHYRRTDSHSHDASLQELDARLRQLRLQLDELTVRRERTSERIPVLERELDDLRRQLAAAARLEDIDRLNADIAEIDAQTELLKARLSVIERTEASLREVIARLKSQRKPAVLDLASKYLRRLTEEECTGFGVTGNRTGLTVHTRRSPVPVPVSQLSRGTRDQAALALRLALIQIKAADSDRVPLVLDDVFISADDDRAEAAADLLMEVASSGQQILLLTSQNDVRELFVRRRAAMRTLEELPAQQPQQVFIPQPVAVPVPTPVPVREPVIDDQSLVFKAFDGEAEEFPGEMGERIADASNETDARWLFYLETDNPVEDLAGLTVAEIAALQSVDIQTIDELLQIPAPELEHRFRDQGFLIDSERIHAWQGQAELSCRIPMLRRRDAALLYAAGIRSVEQMSRLRPEAVFDLLTAFQYSDSGRHYLRAGRAIDRQEAINWTRWALHARSMEDARRHRHEYHSRSGNGSSSQRSSTVIHSTGRARSSSGTGSVRRQRRPGYSGESQRTRSERFSRRRRRMERKAESRRTTRVASRLMDRDNDRRSRSHSESSSGANGSSNGNGNSGGHGGTEWKFYLSRSSDVEAAPSIGPKTAERLARANILTVDDLLNASPETVVAQLNNRRITVEVVEQWQAQAAMVCQIPQLRGHDAQILVACGYGEAEEVASQQPSDLLAEVAPFCESAEGQRIVRGGKMPDLEEVTNWINWAQNSRSLKAA
ncbi:MAG: DUF4332 domain-containing protein [Planctomycetaceae bacterium]